MKWLQCIMLAMLALLAWMALPAAGSVRADTVHLTGLMLDDRGHPMAGARFRLVLGGEPASRAPGSGRILTTDAQGRFALNAPVTLSPRRIRLYSALRRHDSRLMEIGLGFDLIGRPALYWVEVDFIGQDALRGITAFVAGPDGTFDRPLTFHRREHAWSLPDDPVGMRLSDIGADLRIESASAGEGGVWRLDVVVTRQAFQLR